MSSSEQIQQLEEGELPIDVSINKQKLAVGKAKKKVSRGSPYQSYQDDSSSSGSDNDFKVVRIMMQNSKQNKKKKKLPLTTKIIRKDKKDQKYKPTNKFLFITRDESNKPICKLNLDGLCKLQADVCNFSHDTRNYPCKLFHSTGECKSHNDCGFSHHDFVNEQQLEEFIRDNDKYLLELMKLKGPLKNQSQIDNYFRQQQIKQIQQQQQQNKMVNYQQQFNSPNIMVNNKNNSYQHFNNIVPSLNQIPILKNNNGGLGLYDVNCMNNQNKMFHNQAPFQCGGVGTKLSSQQQQWSNVPSKFPSLSSLTSNIQFSNSNPAHFDYKLLNNYQSIQNNNQQMNNNQWHNNQQTNSTNNQQTNSNNNQQININLNNNLNSNINTKVQENMGQQQGQNKLQEKKKQELLEILRKDPEKMKQILNIAKDLKQNKEESKEEQEKERQVKEENLQKKLRNLGLLKSKDPRLNKNTE